MSDKKNEDYELRSSESFGGDKDGFLSRPPPRPRPALASPISKIDNSPGIAILAYCFSSISMTVVNKYVVSGQFWNLNFLYLAVQVSPRPVCSCYLFLCLFWEGSSNVI